MPITMKEVIEKYISSNLQDTNNRYKSWEHCYQAFGKRTESNDLLALHLGFYLASWGMYRGSSGLLWKDYKIHCNAVEIIKDHYNLRQETSSELPSKEEIFDLFEKLSEYYSQITYLKGGGLNNITPTHTLISKIILGTLGCLPACDRYFSIGFSNKEYFTINVRNIEEIINDANEKNSEIKISQHWVEQKTGIGYPIMKIIDMYYWQKGFDQKG